MRVDDFDYILPEELIALRPAVPRDAARLLVVRGPGNFAHCHVRDLPALLAPGDMLVVNRSRVLPARLEGTRPARRAQDKADEGAVRVECLLYRRTGPADFTAMVRPARRLRRGDRICFGSRLAAVVTARKEGEVEMHFDRAGGELDSALSEVGQVPLPPYIARRRAADARDREDYQTIFAAEPGSVAAPTAGLHFTPELLRALENRGIRRAEVTLHVGPGTFLPVGTAKVEDHVMHPEQAALPPATARALNAARAEGGRIVAVGTTALRTLETAAGPDGVFHAFAGETDLFITPGYRFNGVDILLTNFHLPRSTLFMLVCAFCGTATMKAAYAEAVARRYRFYSYGDACLLFRATP